MSVRRQTGGREPETPVIRKDAGRFAVQITFSDRGESCGPSGSAGLTRSARLPGETASATDYTSRRKSMSSSGRPLRRPRSPFTVRKSLSSRAGSPAGQRKQP